MIVLLGIDDTDDASSRGTGYQARRLGASLGSRGLAELKAVTRHQLMIDPQINYTCRNSAICLVLEVPASDVADLPEAASAELDPQCAPNSNPGIAIAEASAIDEVVWKFGAEAKTKVLSDEDARKIAEETDVRLEDVKGNGQGVIGALAAIGLNASGNDGRFIWLPKLRELYGRFTVGELERLLEVKIEAENGDSPPIDAEVVTTHWLRPVMRDGRAILLTEKEVMNGEIRWHVADKQTVKILSD